MISTNPKVQLRYHAKSARWPIVSCLFCYNNNYALERDVKLHTDLIAQLEISKQTVAVVGDDALNGFGKKLNPTRTD